MSAILNPIPSRELESSVAFVEELFRAAGARSFAVRFWTGLTLRSRADITPQFTIILKHRGALGMFSSGTEVSMGEAYIFDDCDVEGDLEARYVSARRLPQRTGASGHNCCAFAF
jgi:cyclopropane-fatty-acyl-phospholipid synthase